MGVRYGILVQMAQILAQAFIDWCIAKDKFIDFSFLVPRECVTGLDDGRRGVIVTIALAPAEEQEGTQ